VVEGFDVIAVGEPPETGYPDYRGGSDSWRASVGQVKPVAWRTAAVAESAPTAFAFTASMSEEVGEFSLVVDGNPAVAFQTGSSLGARAWEGNGYRMTFVPKMAIGGYSGVMVLQVAADKVHPGIPVELRVEPVRGNGEAWFMVKGIRDTAAYERMTPASANDALEGGWSEVKQ
jgi:hypothetical protein